jgi:hypothetical protein
VLTDHSTLPRSPAGKSSADTTRIGATFDETWRQEAAGIGHGMPLQSQSSQWLQGGLEAPLSDIGAVDGAANAATVMVPLASTARQAKTAARARKRFIGR